MTFRTTVSSSFEEIVKACDFVVDNIKNKVTNHHGLVGIYGVPRGGLVPAVMIHHRLKNLKPDLLFFSSEEQIKNTSCKLIVVDEIADTGKTFKLLKEKYPNAFYVSLFKRYDSKFIPDLYFKEIEHDSWIIFPWEIL